MNCLTACQTLPWPARSPDLSSIEHVWDMMARRLNLSGNVDDLALHLEYILQELQQEIIKVLYHCLPPRVEACIQAIGCSRCLTQNSKRKMWSKFSKETSAKSRRQNIAVCEAVSEYNLGTLSLEASQEIQRADNLDLRIEAIKIAATQGYIPIVQRRCSRLFSSVYSIRVCLVGVENKRLSFYPTDRVLLVASTSDK
ncbi:transposable element Tcb1 transposase [Trichonephila clavipes]|uniref:Transposable element Tcb1 transposase n=1 Tax=Trichonephila clavipes TaxID=2585209 RepID=A0A8X7B7X0_TRICX|nr:transposable element Tcb1 transposase [Trichonephila clavipes]